MRLPPYFVIFGGILSYGLEIFKYHTSDRKKRLYNNIIINLKAENCVGVCRPGPPRLAVAV
jgi:hypothetical protein